MNNIAKIWAVAKKEYVDALRNRVFLAFLFFLLFLIGVSIVVATFDFQSKMVIYQKALSELQQSGQIIENLSAPQFFPLQLLRGAIEYLEIIGAILAIILGYLSIAKEKGNNTLQLILTRPISRFSVYLGKFLGNILLIISALGFIFIGIILVVDVIGKTMLTSDQLYRILFTFIFTIAYLLIFFSISALLAIWFKSLPNALIISFVIWIFFVLVIPQVGDTMDPDNQVPGGLFNSLHIEKSGQTIILEKFLVYEKTRDALEQASFTKHYERLVFAILGIKDMYNGKSLAFIFNDRVTDVWWIILADIFFCATGATVFVKKRTLWREE
jgi:ABC-2 type transport system permease protein